MLMKEGKLKAVMRLLEEANNSPLPLNDEVKESLRKKRPARQPPHKEAVLDSSDSTTNFHPIFYEQIDGKLILDRISTEVGWSSWSFWT